MERVKNVIWICARKKDFADLPEESGIYVIVAAMTNGKNYVFYSGQTNNIKKRALEHWSDAEPNEKIMNIISKHGNSIFMYYALVHGNSLDGHERFLYETFEPQAQSRVPNVESKPVSLDSHFAKGKINEKYFE